MSPNNAYSRSLRELLRETENLRKRVSDSFSERLNVYRDSEKPRNATHLLSTTVGGQAYE